MNIQNQFYQFYRPYLKKVYQAIIAGKSVILVGINAIGKTLLAEQIMSSRFRKEFLGKEKVHLVLLEFKDRFSPSGPQIYRYWLKETARILDYKRISSVEYNIFSFYSEMTEIIRNLPPDEKIAFILLDAQNILHLDELFYKNLTFLQIYSAGKISYILLSEPQILDNHNPWVQVFIQHSVHSKFNFLKPFDRKTALADIKRLEIFFKTKFEKYYSLILRYAKGLHGAIYIFCEAIKRNPGISDIRQLKKVINNDKLCQFRVREVINSLPAASVRILQEISRNKEKLKNYRKNLFGQWLVSLGLLKNNGSLRYPLMFSALSQYPIIGVKKGIQLRLMKKQFYINNEIMELSRKEYLVLRVLYKLRGKLVTYDRIGNLLWRDNPERYSLWAISQIIRRIRKRLAFYNLNPKIIRSRRAEGYLFD